MLEIDSVTVDYGGLRALDAVSLAVDEGETVAVVGANGAGKSTLFKAISGSVPMTAGTISFGGEDLVGGSAASRARRGIAHVPEGRRVFGSLSVQDNLRLGVMDGSKPEPRLQEIYQMFPVLAERRKQLADQLSGGQQQMLAIGRGLVSRPKLLMLDEPSMGLAPSIADMIFDRIGELAGRGEMAILLVEQRAAEALDIVDRGYLLDTGRIVAEGDSRTLRSSDFVRETYLGLTEGTR